MTLGRRSGGGVRKKHFQGRVNAALVHVSVPLLLLLLMMMMMMMIVMIMIMMIITM